MDSNNIFTFFYPVIESLSKGSLIKRVMFFLFSLIGVLSFVGGGYFFFKSISYVPDFWSAVLLFLFFLSSFLSLQVWFYRAKAIMNLEDSEFTVIPIFSNLFRALGENYALFLITVGLGGTLMLWFSNYGGYLWSFISYIPFVSSLTDTFIGGILFLLVTTIIAFLVLLLTYFLAENILVLVQIAKNTSGLKKEIVEEK
jgi:hypothetical protein